ncbi:carbohydrate ABC transporter substrate-binding protein [Pseudarthrobacter sp. J75]|uniref:ABC transporter substrate-binding protein n=1 Tax=unclassified Pseudarthrobacter TaxID=2647000 RepID=UPI002E81DA31|nr:MULTISPECIES: carbohydrate ABC transporter substrate-binding protein [unclassified Pseudarthrobacter]MEE2523486.1 carbohydrate ABC transporter substrate-binding protein [Pseudarthrobacter sp. J47]MEE2530461.1 carbohydrate ABC transporter substrate-binding protein [Pseudarthrobacter sp. J75]
MKNRKYLLPMAATGILALTLSACSSDGGTETPSDVDCTAYESYGQHEGKTVSVYSTIVDLEATNLEQTWAAFEECTGATIKYEGSKEFETQIGVRAQAGNAPDIAIFPQPGLMADQARAGNLKPAPQTVSDAVDENWSADWKKYGTVDGTFYAAPMLANVKGFVWYAPKTFEDNGWEVPTTWDEMMELSNTIADAGAMKPWCAGFESGEATGWPGTDWIEDVVLRAHGPEVYDQWVAHEIPFNDPKIVEAFNTTGEILLDDKMVNGGFGDVRSILTTGFAQAGQPVLDGQCAMHHQANFQASNWPEGTVVAPDGDVWAFMTPPIDESKGQAITGGGEMVAAYKDTPEVQAFQAYMASAEFANDRVKLGGVVSANKGLDPENAQSELDKLSIELLQDPDTVFRFDGSDLMPGAVGSNSFWKGIVSWINGTPSEDVVNSIESSWPAS